MIRKSRASQWTNAGLEPDGKSGVSSDMEIHETPPLTAAEESLVDSLVADGLSIQDRFRPEPLYRHTGKGHYESATVDDIRKAKAQPRSPETQ